MEGEHIGPFNLGNPGEFTMLELAEVCPFFSFLLPVLRTVFVFYASTDDHSEKEAHSSIVDFGY